MKLLHKTLLAAVAASCFATTAAAAKEQIVGASDVGYPPFAMAAPDGSFTGYDMDITAEISKRIGTEIKIIDQPWSTTFAGLNARKFDMVVAAATMTPERAKNFLFTQAYGDATYQFLVPKSAGSVDSPEDMRGKVIAVNKGNIFDKWLTEREDEYKWTINRFDKNSDAIQAVASGQADGALIYSATVGWAAQQVPSLTPSNFVVNDGQVYGYMFRVDDHALRDRVDWALNCMKQDGTLAELYRKWTGLDPLPGGAIMTPSPGRGQPGVEHYDPTPPKACTP